MDSPTRCLKWGLAAALVSLGCGCGKTSERMRLWGEVSYDGAPLAEGVIRFTPVDGTHGPSTGGTIQQGHYEVAAPAGAFPRGVYRVEISALRPSGRKIKNFMLGGEEVDQQESFLPARYNQQSTLQITVSEKADENQFDFALTP